MCKVSDKLKLCTCEVPDNNRHYWLLYRWVKGKNEILIGEFMLPFFIDKKINQLNNQLLVHLLNEGNVFDGSIFPKERDRLALSFYTPGVYSEYLTYGFSYWRKKWHPKGYDWLEWQRQHDTIKKGIILNALALQT